MIEGYRVAQNQRLLERAMRLWDDAEADHHLAQLDRLSGNVH